MKRIYLIAFFLQVSACCCSQAVFETLYLHLDKDSYLPGETIWFKAYLYNGINASVLSTNLYAALYNTDGKLLRQKQYPIFDGSSYGDFSIPDSTEGSSLQLLVFTKGMRLNDSSRSYYRRIPLINTATQANITISEEDKIQLQFFAEGGTPATGVANYYAFRAWHNNGQPAQIKGGITETGANTVIDSFYTNEQGLGSMQFIPQPGKTYRAVWIADNGQQQITALPEAAATGTTLHAELAGKTLYYVLAKNNKNAQNFTVTVSNAQTVLYTADVQMNETAKYVGKLPADSLTNGLVWIRLEDETKKLLAERIMFIDNAGGSAQITQPVIHAAAKAQNSIEIILPDTLLYNLSASISDINFYDSTTHQNIQSSFLLKDGNLPPAGSNAGLFLQTNQYHTYAGTANLQSADNYLILTVNYTEKSRYLPARERLNMMIKDSIAGNQFYDLMPATPTSFIKPGLIFYDSVKVFYKTTVTKEIENYLSLQRDEPGLLPAYITPVKKTVYTVSRQAKQKTASLYSFTNGKSQEPRKFNEQQTLKTVIIKSKNWGSPETRRLNELEEKYTTGLFRGLARGYQINVLDDEKSWGQYDVYSYISYKLPMLTSSGFIGNRKLTDRFRGGPGILFIDEVESPLESLETISVERLAYIKYIQGVVIGSSFTSASGALYIYTKKGDEPSISYLPQMRSKMIKGYDLPKQFPSPDYTSKQNQQDRRTTLYWNPYLTTEKDNKTIRIEYNNNDVSKKLLLVVEGINEEGRLIYLEKIIEN